MKPTAAPNVWPYPGHRNMAQVLSDEARQTVRRRAGDASRYLRERRSARG